VGITGVIKWREPRWVVVVRLWWQWLWIRLIIGRVVWQRRWGRRHMPHLLRHILCFSKILLDFVCGDNREYLNNIGSTSHVWFSVELLSSGDYPFVTRIVVPLPRGASSSFGRVTKWWLWWHLIVIMYIIGWIVVGS